ncbi:MAG TPA: diguanylate cyclase [Vicinamibacterales bacterium]|nr:diguanylate cyclase [Vicinamibacterales bacterium]
MTAPVSDRPILLCIDDDPLQHRIVERLIEAFEHSRYACEGALTYDEGLTALASGRHAACLLDYQLDDRTGLDLLLEARRLNTDTPVIVITVADTEDVDIAAAEAGAVDFLPKANLNPRLLERAVRYAVKMGATLKQLRALALRDELTGLLNRRELHTLLQDEWLRSARFKRPFSVGVADIDYFKRVNDEHGHPAGDEVIRHVGRVLEATLRRLDRVARVGGEEFAILMPETGRQEAIIAMERVRAALARSPCVLPGGGVTLPVTLSIGVGVSLEDADNPDALFGVADKRLYAAKRGGRDRVVANDHSPRA